jgi:hypothetical protein
MHLIQNIKQKSIARNTMILLAAITLGTAVATDALAAGHGGGGHGGGFGGGAHMGGGGRGGFVRNPTTTLLGSPAPQMPAFENRIPAPLSSPAQAPLVNGPMSQPAFRGMTGIGQ